MATKNNYSIVFPGICLFLGFCYSKGFEGQVSYYHGSCNSITNNYYPINDKCSPSYRNQSVDLKSKSIDCFLYDVGTLVVGGLILLKQTESLISHCVKSVQIRSFFWSVFSHIWNEYGDLFFQASKYLLSPGTPNNQNRRKIALRYGRSPVNLLHVFRTRFLKNTSGGMLPKNNSSFTDHLFICTNVRSESSIGFHFYPSKIILELDFPKI